MVNHPNRSKITPRQMDLLLKMQGDRWHCAYALGFSTCAQLERLEAKGLVKSRASTGHIFSPTTHIWWRLARDGKAAIQAASAV